MKKLLAIIICLLVVFLFGGCNAQELPENTRELPKGENVLIALDRAGSFTAWDFISYEYINETTVKAVRENAGNRETFYIPTTNIIYIVEKEPVN